MAIPAKQAALKQLVGLVFIEVLRDAEAYIQKAEHGHKKVQETTVEQVIGGMRGIRAMLWDASVLDHNEVCTLCIPRNSTAF